MGKNIEIKWIHSVIMFSSFISFSLLFDAVILLLNCPVLILYLYIHFLSLRHYLFYFKHYLELHITATALIVSRSLYSFTTSICHGVEKLFLQAVGHGHL